MTGETRLVLRRDGAAIPLPLGSSRQLSVSVEPIEASAQLRRTINGELRDLSDPAFRRYRVTLSATDQVPPAIGALWPGDLVDVEVPYDLTEPVIAGAATLTRDLADNTEFYAYDAAGLNVPAACAGRELSAPGAAYVTYRPRLACRVSQRSERAVDRQATSEWSLVLEEV